MKIQLGGVTMVENKTKKYLLPCLKSYGDEFTRKINTVWKVAIGIGDIVTIKSNINFEKHIFLLCETKKDTESFLRFLDWIREHEMYEEDYAFDNINDGCLHMLVIKMPEKFYDAYETFKRSEFSHMYSKEDLETFFKDKPDVVKILIRDHNYKLEFSKFLEKEYGVHIPVSEIDETFEFDLPISEYEEMFNTDLN